MILIHIYPYVALNAACEMSRAETGEREREKEREVGEPGRCQRETRERERERREGRGERTGWKNAWVEMARR